MTWTAATLQVALPVLIILAVTLLPMRSATRVLWALGAGFLLLSAARIVLWHVPPIWVVWVFLVLLVTGTTLASLRGQAQSRAPSWAGRVGFALSLPAALLSVAVFAVIQGKSGAPSAEVEVVELAAPLAEGRYLVAHGGASGMLNAHTAFVANHPRGRDFAGQEFAVDLLGLGTLWLTGPLFGDGPNAAYAIWDTPVIAPCSGQVITATDGQPDMPPPERDRSKLTGNHVLLECDGYHVLLAHFRQGTVRVSADEDVATGAEIGRVGNSGNTTQPHLHIHVQRPGAADRPLSGQSLPFTINGQWLVRNDRLVIEGP